MDTLIKIKIIGHGGHGVKFLTTTLAKILGDLNFNVSVIFDYDAAVRGGSIEADLVYSLKSIDNPLIAHADICLSFVGIDRINQADRIINLTDSEWTGKIAQLEPAIKKHINMIALGYLLKVFDLDLSSVNLNKRLDLGADNILAIRAGYNLKQNFAG